MVVAVPRSTMIYWKTQTILFIMISGATIRSLWRQQSPPALVLLVPSHSDCGTMDAIVSDTTKEDAEETYMFGRPIR